MGNLAAFEQRVSEVDLDYSGDRIQACEIVTVYWINAYQTCFVGAYGEPGSGTFIGFRYVYHRPMPLFLFFGKTADTNYFRNAERGRSLVEVFPNGEINFLYN